MSNEVRIKVTGQNESGAAFADVNKDLAETTVAAYAAGKAYDDLGKNMTDADRIGSRLGDNLRKTKKTKVSDLLDPDPGPSFANKFASNLQGAFAGSPGLAQVGGVVAAIMAPSMAAGLGAAVAGGVGLGGIAGGVALAAKDPAIKAYAGKIGKDFSSEVTKEAGVFKAPVIDALHQIEGQAGRTGKQIGQIFQNTAGSVSPLTGALVRTVDALGDDLVKASSRSAPALEALGGLIEGVGSSVGDMLETLSRDAPAGASAIDDLTGSLESMIDTTTNVVHGLAQLKTGADDMDGGIDSARNSIEDFFTSASGGRAVFDITADGYTHGSEAAKLYSEGVIGAAGSVNDYEAYQRSATGATNDATSASEAATSALKAQQDAVDGVANSLKAMSDPLFAVIDAEDAVTDKQRAYNKALKEHGRNSEEARDASRDLNKAFVNLTLAAARAGEGTGHLTAEQKALLRSAGASKARIQELDNSLYEAWKQAKKLDGYNVDVTVTTLYRTLGKQDDAMARRNPNRASGGVQGAASGGARNGLTLVGEAGPELVDIPAGSTVHSNPDSMRMAGGGGSTSVDVMVRPAPNAARDLMSMFIEQMRYEIRTSGAGDVVGYFGGTR